MSEIQILRPKPIIFKNTIHVAAARCQICNHHPAVAYQPVINGQAYKDLRVCEKYLAMPPDIRRAAIMATIYPVVPRRETVPAMEYGGV